MDSQKIKFSNLQPVAIHDSQHNREVITITLKCVRDHNSFLVRLYIDVTTSLKLEYHCFFLL
jgi:hypothetical protein